MKRIAQLRFKKYGLNKTIKKLRKSFGQEKITEEYYCTKCSFPYFPGHIEIREDARSPFNESILILPYDKKY